MLIYLFVVWSEDSIIWTLAVSNPPRDSCCLLNAIQCIQSELRPVLPSLPGLRACTILRGLHNPLFAYIPVPKKLHASSRILLQCRRTIHTVHDLSLTFKGWQFTLEFDPIRGDKHWLVNQDNWTIVFSSRPWQSFWLTHRSLKVPVRLYFTSVFWKHFFIVINCCATAFI